MTVAKRERYKSNFADPKIFKARVYLHRINIELQKFNSINNSKQMTNHTQKERNCSGRKTKSDFDRYLQRKTERFKHKEIKSVIMFESTKLFKQRYILSDRKLKMKCHVILTDVKQDLRFQKYFCSNQLGGRPSILRTDRSKCNVDSSSKKHVTFHPSTNIKDGRQSKVKFPGMQRKSLEFTGDLYPPQYSNHKDYNHSCNTKFRSIAKRKSSNAATNLPKIKQLKIGESNFSLVTSSINNINIPAKNIYEHETSTPNSSQVLAYSINSYSSGNSSGAKLNIWPALPNVSSKKVPASSSTSLAKRDYEADDNQVTSTQDTVLGATTVPNPLAQISNSHVDIQNNSIDTTLEESHILHKDILKSNQRKQLRVYTCNMSSIPSRASYKRTKAFIAAQEITHSSQDEISISSSLNEFSNLFEQNQGQEYETRPNDRNQNVADPAKTYSYVDVVKTVFVPPEIEKIIEANQQPG